MFDGSADLDANRDEGLRLRRLAEETRAIARKISLRPDRERLLHAADELEEAARRLTGEHRLCSTPADRKSAG